MGGSRFSLGPWSPTPGLLSHVPPTSACHRLLLCFVICAGGWLVELGGCLLPPSLHLHSSIQGRKRKKITRLLHHTHPTHTTPTYPTAHRQQEEEENKRKHRKVSSRPRTSAHKEVRPPTHPPITTRHSIHPHPPTHHNTANQRSQAMPPKGKPGAAKKADAKKAEKLIEDKTFGLKNKNKSKKVSPPTHP